MLKLNLLSGHLAVSFEVLRVTTVGDAKPGLNMLRLDLVANWSRDITVPTLMQMSQPS